MPIFVPGLSIKNYKDVPVSCTNCGVISQFSRGTGQNDVALIENANYQGFLQELSILERIEDLFRRFPNSKHPAKISKEEMDECVNGFLDRFVVSSDEVTADDSTRSERIPPVLDENDQQRIDAEFEQSMNEDAEVAEALTRQVFLLQPRLRIVREAVRKHLECASKYRIPCEVCGVGTLQLEQRFYKQMG